MCPRGLSGPPAVTLTKWLKCACQIYEGSICHRLKRFRRRMEKKLGGSKKTEVLKSFFVLGFGDILRVTLGRLMNLNYMEEGGPPPEKVWSNMCRIVIFWTNLDEKLCLQEWEFLFLTFWYWNVLNGIEIISNNFENKWRGLGVE